MIVKLGKDFLLFDGSGRVKGRHKTLAQAKKQEAAINISKARRAGYRIPGKKKA